jgi:preprotein translocase subunit YajC
LATSPFVRREVTPPTTDGYNVGDRVTLDSCGMGRVLKVTDDFVIVDFGAAGVRQVAAGATGFSLL